MDIKQLRQEYAELDNTVTEQKRLGRNLLNNPKGPDGRLTEEQEAQYQALETSIDENEERLAEVGRDMARWEKLQDLERDMPPLRSGHDASSEEPYKPSVIETPKLYHTLGDQLKAIYNRAMGYASPDNRLDQINAAALGAGEAIGSEGGFLVQSDFASEIFRIMHQGGELLSRVRRTPVSGNGLKMPAVNETSRVTGSRFGAVQGYWLDEGTAPTASQPKFNTIELSLKKLGALGYATDELLADTTAMTTIYTEAFGEELRWLAENAIINGTGAGQPMGILNAAATVSQAKETGQAAATVLSTNLSKMWARLHVGSRANSAWFINQDIEPQLDELFITAGTGALEPRVITYSPEGALRIKGKPVIPVEYCATLGTVGDIILADLSKYIMIDKNGVTQDSSMHVRFTTDEMAFRAIYRVDGQPLWKSALTPANGSNTLSPFVTLATRA